MIEAVKKTVETSLRVVAWASRRHFTTGKVEIILIPYRAYGVEVVSMLDLPFALALYDSERRMLLLARDKKGKRPLYYCFKSGRVLFSSEPKGVLAT